jgi:glycerophosphoryl diester phosphodiesterase
MLDLPPVIGHRGAAAHAPENTLASFAKAADLGCRMVEFDVRLTKDCVPIVFHDDTLERRTNGSGPVGAKTLLELKRLDAGAGERIPTLDEVLALCLERGMAVNIELKPAAGAERATTIAALAAAGRLWPSDRPPPLLSSFSRAALALAGDIAPWPRGLLVDRVPAGWRQLAESLGCVAVHAHHRWLSAGRAAEIRAAGFALLAYTINTPRRAQTLWSRGAVAVFSDAPDRIGVPAQRKSSIFHL